MFRRFVFGLLLSALVPPALAQQYPARPIRIIVPFAVGGPSDIMARIMSFIPVSKMVASPNAFIAHPTVPVKSMQELVKFIQANPKKFSMATPGIGTTPDLSAGVDEGDQGSRHQSGLNQE